MSLAIVHTRAKCGIDAPLVKVETHLSSGLPALNIVGLPETAVRESKDRVRSALINSHFEFPARRITINLAPADLPKEGGRFDLPIALGILAASGQIPVDALNDYEFVGELALSGELRPVSGALAAARQSLMAKRRIILPTANADEAALCGDQTVYAANHLLTLCAHLHGREALQPKSKTAIEALPTQYPDLNEVKGQYQARRALEIAAAGNHNLLFNGPPGTGKTMLASRLPGILPPLSEDELLDVANIYTSGSANYNRYTIGQRPFRSPHHSASAAALVGGGNPPQPGEISLAHHGVLLLDELPEFKRSVLEVLREPIESGQILISRAARQVMFPANFQLIATMNPCPCGYYGDTSKHCQCTPDRIRRYREKISGPLLDRIDMRLTVNRIPAHKLRNTQQTGEPSAVVRGRVIQAREKQLHRQGTVNAKLESKALFEYCQLTNKQQQWLDQTAEKLELSPRAYFRLLRVARTIADLEAVESVSDQHLHEAASYRKR